MFDWFTVAAQIVNFLILVVLLKYFLYDRIIRAMDEREQKIRSRLEEAEKMKQKSEEEAEKYRQKNKEIEEKRTEMLEEAKNEVEKEHRKLTHQAREDIENLRTRWRESVEKDKASFLQELKRLVGNQICAVSRHALRDLADRDLEEHVVRVFLKKMVTIKEKEKSELAQAFQGDGNRAIVRSGFELSESQRQQITKVLNEQIAKDATVDYEEDPDIIFGIEIKGRGEKVAWSLASYMKALEDQIREALEREGQGSEAAASTPEGWEKKARQRGNNED